MFKSRGIWRRDNCSIVTDISEEPAAAIFRVPFFVYPEDDNDRIYRNVYNYLPHDSSSYLGRLDTLSWPLWWPKSSHQIVS
jgi:hypothetical protein